MYTVYILKSRKAERYYVGYSADVEQRIKSHNGGKVRSTKAYRPWDVVYEEAHTTKQDAYRREHEIKSYKGGDAFRILVEEEKRG